MKKLMLTLTTTIAFMGMAHADCGKPPANYKAIATEYLNTRLKDPDSAKIKIGEVLHWDAGSIPNDHGQAVTPCWYVTPAVNGKTSFGGYSGWRGYIIWIQNGKAVGMIERH